MLALYRMLTSFARFLFFPYFCTRKSIIKILLNHERNYRSKKNVCGNRRGVKKEFDGFFKKLPDGFGETQPRQHSCEKEEREKRGKYRRPKQNNAVFHRRKISFGVYKNGAHQ